MSSETRIRLKVTGRANCSPRTMATAPSSSGIPAHSRTCWRTPVLRGAEVFWPAADDREGQQGCRWRDIDLGAGTLRVFGKAQEWKPTVRDPLERYKYMFAPASDAWPIFPRRHGPSKYRTARTALADEYGLDNERSKRSWMNRRSTTSSASTRSRRRPSP